MFAEEEAMKVVLVFPPMTLQERYEEPLEEAGPILPPLGLAYIAAVLEKNGVNVEIIDSPALGLNNYTLQNLIVKKKPDVVGIMILTPTAYRTYEVTKTLKEALPELIIVVGGPHASLFPLQILYENPCVDITVFGEGEYTMQELIEKLENNKGLREVRGIAYRQDGQIIQNEPRPFIENLDELPFPARHLLPMDKYRPPLNMYKRKPVAHIIGSRGCPYRCAFCSKAIFGSKHRIRSPMNVVEEIKLLVEEYNIKEISFWDDTFTFSHKWVSELCKLMREEGWDIPWTCCTRVNLVSKELLRKMQEAGCWQVAYGIETGSQELLDLLTKDITLDQVRRAVEITKSVGLEVRGYFMLALPGETKEHAEQTIKFAKDLKLDYVNFCLTAPYPGTKLMELAEKLGDVIVKDYSKYTEFRLAYLPQGRGEQEVLATYKKAYRAFYTKPTYVLERLLSIRSREDIIRHLKALKTLCKL